RNEVRPAGNRYFVSGNEIRPAGNRYFVSGNEVRPAGSRYFVSRNEIRPAGNRIFVAKTYFWLPGAPKIKTKGAFFKKVGYTLSHINAVAAL
ncbi:MAG: hypothetical protein KDI62_28340, partial [Anaerolineae bacterium]|nr:hypothetical protein [Anaerolineae bacterium]